MPAASSSALHQARGHAHGLLADSGAANFVENVQAGLAGVKRGNLRSAVQIAEGVVARIDAAGFESKRAAVRDPSRERGTQFGPQIFAHVQVSDTRSATQPLEDSADRKINA